MTDLVTPESYARAAEALEAAVGQVIVGQRQLVRQVLIAVLCEGHGLIEGVPGLGKTLLLKTLGQAMRLDFGRIQFTPDLMPADICGTQVLEDSDDGHRRFRFRSGPVFANLVLADEVNRATPKTQSALLEAMQERAVTVAGETRALPRPFFVMATQNPLEMEGTYPLPEAQLDRFFLKILVPFPSAADMADIVERTTNSPAPDVEPVLDGPQLREMIGLTRQVPVASHLVEHAVALVMGTHPEQAGAHPDMARYVRFGASPRGAQALILGAKAAALLDGRPNVSAKDIRDLAPAVLRHRLVLGYEAAADGVSADDLIATLLDSVPEPSAGIRGAP